MDGALQPETQAQRTRNAYRVAGMPVIDASVDEALSLIWADASTRHSRVFIFTNGYSATLRREEPSYRDAMEDHRCVCLPDGAPVALSGAFAKRARFGRCPGPDLLEAACAKAAGDGSSFFLLGGGPGVAATLAQRLTDRHPGLKIAGTATPPFGEWSARDDASLVFEINAASPSVVWMGVSAPKQELWALRNLEGIGRPVVCVGAAFDFLSESKPRAPHWMRSTGLEWLFRLISEPRRLWRRYLFGNARFILDLIVHGAHREDDTRNQ